MRRLFALSILALVGLFLVPGTAPAAKPTIGIGGFGGLSIPIVQDDVKSGSMFGVRVPITLMSMISVEPFFASSSLGDGEQEIGGITYTRDGFDNKTFGVNAFLGSLKGNPGFRIYPYVGIASAKLTRAGSEDIKKTAYNFGMGLGVSPAASFSVHLRGELDMVVIDDVSRKFGNATLGVSYDLWPRP